MSSIVVNFCRRCYAPLYCDFDPRAYHVMSSEIPDMAWKALHPTVNRLDRNGLGCPHKPGGIPNSIRLHFWMRDRGQHG